MTHPVESDVRESCDSARQRRERRLRAVNRHELLAIEMEISSAVHHSRQIPCIIPVPVFVTKTKLSNSMPHVLDS